MIGKPNIFLIGPMGSGKTAVGRQLARLLGVPFYDSDAEVERRAGVDIPYIFEQEGEAGFRQREIEAIDALTRLEPVVMATGGGAILRPENRAVLRERGTVVYLETSLGQQLQRVGSGKGRPLLRDADPAERLRAARGTRAALPATRRSCGAHRQPPRGAGGGPDPARRLWPGCFTSRRG